MNEKPHHATIRLERSYGAPLELVFAEFADPVARARWGAPDGDGLVYDQADFRVGGQDVFRCGPQGDLKFRGQTHYLVIVENERVILSEVLDMSGKQLAISLSTLEFEAETDGARTKVRVTVQLVSFVGEGIVKGFESGYAGALDNLAEHLDQLLHAGSAG